MTSRSRSSRSSRSRTSQRKHQRKHHDLEKNDPEHTWRCNQYLLVRRLQSEVEERYKMVRYTEADLVALGCKLGAPLDVDDPKPLDFDSRFFVPSTRQQARKALRSYAKGRWTSRQPLKIPHRATFHGPDAKKKFESKILSFYAARSTEADGNLHYFTQAAMMSEPKGWSWDYNSQPCRKGNPVYMQKAWFNSSGEPVSHECGWEKWTYSEDDYSNPVSTIPHALGAIYDNMPAKEQQVQKSELYLLLMLIRGQLKNARTWPRHRIIPALAVSFHSRFTARIVQAHLEHGQVVLRLSRLLNLHTAKLPVDGKIIIKWLGSRPMGETRAALPPSIQYDDRDEETVEDKVNPAQSIAVVG
ncbi:unnamed protein product [Clonostachys solani]|uniref:Uncharacterized protein n=1 Tax=Clonostachys solani TaxID=160281 RepID=A0A9N9Z035_9HYPO|nr:unnamed protein product [Clonostachys solani]